MPIPLELIYTVQDDTGADATSTVKLPNGFSLTQYGEFAVGMATLANNFLQGKITGADLCLAVDISGLLLNLTSGADDVEDVGAFQFVATEGRKVVVNVPGLDENLVVPGTNNLDQTNPAIATFIGAMTGTGIVTAGGTIMPCDVGEDDISSIIVATERFRSSGSRS